MRTACIGVLLAGGEARRFGGRPKGLARIGGMRIADRVLRALGEATDEQLVVANHPRAPEWFPQRRIVRDATPGIGPLEGLRTALETAAGAAVIVVAWDMPNVTGALLQALRRRGQEHGADAVVPVLGPQRRPEPLCAYYAARALPTCEVLIARGERRAAALAASLERVDMVGEEVLSRFGPPDQLTRSIDTLESLEALGGTMEESDA